MTPMERKELAVRVALLINEGKIEPMQMALGTPEGGTKYITVLPIDAALTAAKEVTAQKVEPQRVYLVATGEVYEGEETYTRHDKPVPLADQEVLFTSPTQQPAPAQRLSEREIVESAGRVVAEKIIDGKLITPSDWISFAHAIEKAFAKKNGITLEQKHD